MCELGRVGTQLRHHDADVRVEPGSADRLLDEPALVTVRAEVPADVDDAIFRASNPRYDATCATERFS